MTVNYAKTLFEALQDKRKMHSGFPESWRSLPDWEKEAYGHAFEVALTEYDKMHYREDLEGELRDVECTIDSLREELRVSLEKRAKLATEVEVNK